MADLASARHDSHHVRKSGAKGRTETGMPKILICGFLVKTGYEYFIVLFTRDYYLHEESRRPRPVDLVFVLNRSQHCVHDTVYETTFVFTGFEAL